MHACGQHRKNCFGLKKVTQLRNCFGLKNLVDIQKIVSFKKVSPYTSMYFHSYNYIAERKAWNEYEKNPLFCSVFVLLII